jgi:hypothetical protein
MRNGKKSLYLFDFVVSFFFVLLFSSSGHDFRVCWLLIFFFLVNETTMRYDVVVIVMTLSIGQQRQGCGSEKWDDGMKEDVPGDALTLTTTTDSSIGSNYSR